MFRDFFYRLPANLARCFTGSNAIWHLLAMGLTYGCVVFGLDWRYFEATRSESIFSLAFPAAVLGFFVPALVPLSIYLFGVVRRSPAAKRVGSMLVQAALIGLLVSSFYKAFTGRLQPELVSTVSGADISGAFNFGFLRHGIFWGWPSSHTTVAFAMVAALVVLFPRRKAAVAAALLYALYIGLGVSVTIHWFSDFLAGAVIGTVIGIVVGTSYRERKSAAA